MCTSIKQPIKPPCNFSHFLLPLLLGGNRDAWGIESPDGRVWIPWLTTWSAACFGLWHEQEINLHCTESLRVCYTAINLSWLILRSSESRSVEPNWRWEDNIKCRTHHLLDPIKSGITFLHDWTIPEAKPLPLLPLPCLPNHTYSI